MIGTGGPQQVFLLGARVVEAPAIGTAHKPKRAPPHSPLTPTRPAAPGPPKALPGGCQEEHELRAELARLLLSGGPGLRRDPAAAAEAYGAAAEAAEAAFKGKVAARYYELQAGAEAVAEEEGEGEEEGEEGEGGAS